MVEGKSWKKRMDEREVKVWLDLKRDDAFPNQDRLKLGSGERGEEVNLCLSALIH